VQTVYECEERSSPIVRGLERGKILLSYSRLIKGKDHLGEVEKQSPDHVELTESYEWMLD